MHSKFSVENKIAHKFVRGPLRLRNEKKSLTKYVVRDWKSSTYNYTQFSKPTFS